METLPRASAVPAVADALVTAFGTLADVSVLDGPVAEWSEGDAVAVGIGSEAFAVTWLSDPANRGVPGSYSETVDVVCAVWSWTGDADMAPRRARCAAILDDIRALLAADPTLGNTCDRATMGPDLSWIQATGATGTACSVGFSVHVIKTI